MEVQELNRGCYCIDNLLINKEGIISQKTLHNEFYKSEKERASTLIALSIMRELFENNLLNEEEFSYIEEKYAS